MQIKILEKKDNSLRFYMSGLVPQIANGLRRIMIAEVPTMAIDDVIMVENNSPLRDEMIAHRLGLIPLKTDLSYAARRLCDCQSDLGCSKCSVTLTLEAGAPDGARSVYSKELKSSDSDVVPVSGDIPILKLAQGQHVRLEAYARLGTGGEHAKWQPVAVSAYKYAPLIKIDLEKCGACKQECLKSCPKGVLGVKDKRIIILDQGKCDMCRLCVESCPKDSVTVEAEKDAYIYNIESTGALPPEAIVEKALEILLEKTEDFEEQVSLIRKEEKT